MRNAFGIDDNDRIQFEESDRKLKEILANFPKILNAYENIAVHEQQKYAQSILLRLPFDKLPENKELINLLDRLIAFCLQENQKRDSFENFDHIITLLIEQNIFQWRFFGYIKALLNISELNPTGISSNDLKKFMIFFALS